MPGIMPNMTLREAAETRKDDREKREKNKSGR